MSASPRPDDPARTRLRGLGAAAPERAPDGARDLGRDPLPDAERGFGPGSSRGRGFTGPGIAPGAPRGPGSSDREPADSGPDRMGWPTAPPGTPASRLRFAAGPPPRDDRDDDRHGYRDDRGDPYADDDPVESRSGWPRPTTGEDRWSERWADRWLPASLRGARWDPGRGGAVALAAVTALAAVAAAIGVWSDRPVAEPVPALPAIAQGAPAAGPAAPAAPAVPTGPIVVSVTGKVERPGMVRLPPGSRVGDALDAAGGAERGTDLTGLNLAQRLADGEQVVVGVPMPAPAGGVSGPAGAPSAGGAGAAPAGGGAAGDKVDLNTATLEQLDQLPGVGPVTAQKILDWRSQNGRFAAIEQLQEVSGIGEARFAQLRTRVRV